MTPDIERNMGVTTFDDTRHRTHHAEVLRSMQPTSNVTARVSRSMHATSNVTAGVSRSVHATSNVTCGGITLVARDIERNARGLTLDAPTTCCVGATYLVFRPGIASSAC